jgi:transposase
MLNRVYLQKKVWVFLSPVDMRRSYDSLYGLVKSFNSNPLNGDLFLFMSKDRKKEKALFWDQNGLMIWMKRLEKGCFADVFSRGKMTMNELSLFFEGSKSVKNKLSPEDPTFEYTP